MTRSTATTCSVNGGSSTQPCEFDGVICFGGVDWWYHNRGHYDLQMMRELSREMPVLYINSIGMRVPRVREGGMFVKRLRRKLGSLSRGLTRVNDRFAVFSPVVLPGQQIGALTRKTLGMQAAWAGRRVGIRKPLVWVACPPAARAALSMRRSGLVYQRTDRFESYTGVNARAIREADQQLKSQADATLFCSGLLFESERTECQRAVFVDHGVDYEVFAGAGDRREVPADLNEWISAIGGSGPVVGFIGGIDSHTFDPTLFCEVARRLPGVRFALIGACSLAPGWCELPNVRLFGRKPYDQVAAYMGACDVLIMPWAQNEWIKACNPVKLKEYLAVGRPVVTTWFDEVKRYAGAVSIATGAEEFAEAIESVVASPGDQSLRRALVCDQTWGRKAQDVLAGLRDAGVVQKSSAGARSRSRVAESAGVIGGLG